MNNRKIPCRPHRTCFFCVKKIRSLFILQKAILITMEKVHLLMCVNWEHLKNSLLNMDLILSAPPCLISRISGHYFLIIKVHISVSAGISTKLGRDIINLYVIHLKYHFKNIRTTFFHCTLFYFTL